MSKVRFVVHAGPHRRRNCPVVANLPVGAGRPAAMRLTGEASERLPAQVCSPLRLSRNAQPAECSQVVFLLPSLDAGESVQLTAEVTDQSAAGPDAVAVSDDGAGSVTVSVAGELLTTYRYLGNPARPCFFPVIGPSGKRVTRSWPVSDDVPGETQDHPHHRSLWVAHGEVNRTDNWSEGPGHGFQLHRDILGTSSGPVFGSLAALNDWTNAGKRKVLEERRILTAYAVSGEMRMFDLDVCFTATECDVRFGDTKEGGIVAMRVAPAMDGDHGGRIENCYGAIGEAECWGRRAHWCDYVGEIEGERLGIAILDHPQSFRHPTHWHVRDYGMYTANPFGWHDFHSDPSADGSHLLPLGASLCFYYRVILHRGDAAEAGIAARYHDYANPPRVEVVT